MAISYMQEPDRLVVTPVRWAVVWSWDCFGCLSPVPDGLLACRAGRVPRLAGCVWL